MGAPIRTLAELVAVVQELVDSTGKHVYVDDLRDVLVRVVRQPERDAETLTTEDVDQIIEGIEHFVIGIDGDEELRAIWQPYIDKLCALREGR